MHVLAGCSPSDRTEDNYSAGGRKDELSVSQPETGSCSSQVDALPFFFSSPLLSAALAFAISAKEEIKFGKEEVLIHCYFLKIAFFKRKTGHGSNNSCLL